MARNPKVLIILRGGVIQQITADSDVEVYVVNHDDLHEGQNPLTCLEPWSIENISDLLPAMAQELSEYQRIE